MSRIERSRAIANNRLREIDYSPIQNHNYEQRLDPEKQEIINVGKNVYGIFSAEHCAIGYGNSNKLSLTPDGRQVHISEKETHNTESFEVNTSELGFKWNGMSFNPSLSDKPLVYMSDKMIGNIINIINNTEGLQEVSADDIQSVRALISSKDQIDEKLKSYPIMKNLQWKYSGYTRKRESDDLFTRVRSGVNTNSRRSVAQSTGRRTK